jgi:hypothetical protein
MKTRMVNNIDKEVHQDSLYLYGKRKIEIREKQKELLLPSKGV